MGFDYSDDTSLYAAIGGGAAIVLVLLLCCCCCRRKKTHHTETPPLAAIPSASASRAHSVQHQKAPNQKHYAIDMDPSDPYTKMPTSPAVSIPSSGTVMEHPPHYYSHQTTKVFDAPRIGATVTPPTPTTMATNSGGQRPTLNSNSSGHSSVQSANGQMAIADDAAIVASRLPFETITALALISKGGFGEVYKGSYRGNIVAIKRLLPETRRDLKQIQSFFHEVKLLASMDHPHIVRFLGVAWDAFSDLSVLTEYMDGGDLRAALHSFSHAGRPVGFDKQKATLALHIAHALTYMHSLQPVVLHRDLKSKNVLLDATQTLAKLSDFGVSRERNDSTMTAGVGTLLWMAPEVMAGERYDDKADVFSFGIVLSELDTYYLPYADVKARLAQEAGRSLPDTALVQRIMTGRVRVTFSDALRDDVRLLGERCVALAPEDRPTAAHVLYELQKIERSMDSEISIVL